MTDRELRKLKKEDLLSLLLAQSKELDRLRQELEDTKQQLVERRLSIAKSGSLAEASVAIYQVFENAQKAADMYLENVKANANEALDSLFKSSGKNNSKNS